MILSNMDLIKLKVLTLADEDEEDNSNCMECKPDNPNCNLIDLCNRYGSFNFLGGAENMVRDLFDTIESLQDELFTAKKIDNCINCARSDRTLERCILINDEELDCLSENYSHHIRRK